MSRRTPYSELLKLPADDLRLEIRAQSLKVRKLKLGIAMSKEKDTAQHRRERRQLARMQTALTLKTNERLMEAKKSGTMSAPSTIKKAPPEAKTVRKTKASSPKKS